MSTDESTKGIEELRDTGKLDERTARAAISQPLEAEKLLRMQRIEVSLEEIKTCLIGNDYGTRGIVKRMAELEARQAKTDEQLKALRTVWRFLAGVFAAWAAWWAGHK